MKRIGDLEIEDDDAFHRGEQAAQKIGWGLLFLFILGAALGLFGDGPLGKAVAGSTAGPLWVEYERFIRSGSPTHLRIHAVPDPETPGYVAVRLESGYLEAMDVQGIVPEPESSSTSNRQITWVFRVPADSTGSVPVYFSLQPGPAGPTGTTVESGNREPAQVRQFVFP